MALFGKKTEKKKKTRELQAYRIDMNTSGRLADGVTKSVVIREDCEFNAIWAAEKENPRLKVCRSEKVQAQAE